jgi:hypothetical protein
MTVSLGASGDLFATGFLDPIAHGGLRAPSKKTQVFLN